MSAKCPAVRELVLFWSYLYHPPAPLAHLERLTLHFCKKPRRGAARPLRLAAAAPRLWALQWRGGADDWDFLVSQRLRVTPPRTLRRLSGCGQGLRQLGCMHIGAICWLRRRSRMAAASSALPLPPLAKCVVSLPSRLLPGAPAGPTRTNLRVPHPPNNTSVQRSSEVRTHLARHVHVGKLPQVPISFLPPHRPPPASGLRGGMHSVVELAVIVYEPLLKCRGRAPMRGHFKKQAAGTGRRQPCDHVHQIRLNIIGAVHLGSAAFNFVI